MRKPKLCLALSVSLALQANLLPAQSEPASPPIWQKLAGVNASKPVVSGGSAAVARRSAPGATSRIAGSAGVVSSGVSGHAMLFLKNKESGSSAATNAPAAALTIHPSLPLDADQSESTASASTQEQPTLVAMNESSSAAASNKVDSRQLIAQLAPDQIVAQGDAGTTATPIPPVVTGTVELEEFKPSNVIDLKVSQSRTFKLRNKIVRTSISDPAIAEPVVVAENQLVLLGKAPGGATLVIWDDAGNSVAVDVRVTRDYSQLQATLREIDPRIIVKAFSVGGQDRVLLLGDVDHPESVIRAFAAANAFMDDRGMKITAANSRILETRIGEQGVGATAAAGGGGGGQLAQLANVNTFTYFSNLNNNVSKAQVIVSDGGRVTSLVKVRKVPLIVLHVTFMEMNTAAARELAVQLGLNFTTSTFAFGIGGNSASGAQLNPFLLTSFPGTTGLTPVGNGPLTSIATVNGQQVAVNNNGALGGIGPGGTGGLGYTVTPANFTAANVIPVPIGNTGQVQNIAISGVGQAVPTVTPTGLLQQAVLLGAPGGASFLQALLPNIFTAASNFARNDRYRWSINPLLQGVINHNRARILAEPTLVTISGERAAFLAGGEIPIQQSIATAGTSLASVTFEQFGLKLNFIPVLLENGTINLQVAPEARFLSTANGNNLALIGFIPGFVTRKTQTVVELKPGQELFISGLVSANHGRDLSKTPLLGEVPVLGALYRSKAFVKNESELVVAVRPEVIIPGNPGQMKLPEEISRVEGPRDTNILQVEPTVVDERYMTSGRAERPQKVPGILPPGSPIPDSQ